MRILRHHIRAAHARASIPVAAGIVLLALAGPRATAQESPYIDTSHPNVFVDLSVLDDGGYVKQATALPPLAGGRALLVPGAQPPVSRLFVSPAYTAAKPTAAPATTDSRLHVEPPQPPAPPSQTAAVEPPATAPEKLPVSAAPEPPALAPPPAPPAEPETVAKAEPEPEAEPAPKETAVLTPPPAAKAEEQASLPPAAGPPKPGTAMQVVFPDGASKLPGTAKEELQSLAARIKGLDSLRLQLLAYAGGKSLSASKARRLSLSRALAVRSYLIESGVRSTRIDVRALGNKTSEKPENRVDINVVER